MINITIGQLVIDGIQLTRDQQRQLQEGLQSSLHHLLTERGIPAAIHSLSSSDAVPVGAIQLTHPVIEPFRLGEQIGQAVYQGLHHQATHAVSV